MDHCTSPLRVPTAKLSPIGARWRHSGGALLLALLLLAALRFTVFAGDTLPTLAAQSSRTPSGQADFRLMGGSAPEDDENPPGSQTIELKGVVVSASADPQGRGEWRIRTQGGHQYRVVADSQTEFRPHPPAVNQWIQLKGVWIHTSGDFYIRALRIEFDGENDHGGERDSLQGLLISAPPAGIGTWVVQTGLTLTVEIVVDSATRLDDGIPAVGTWLDIRGNWQANNTYAATRIRIENHRSSEVIVRLAPNVISTTVASRYDLIAQETLLHSGNIHLFATREDEEKDIVGKLASDHDVLWAELNYVGGIPEGHGYKTWRWGGTTPDGYVNQGAFDQVNLAPALDAFQGQGVVIAVLDTGINQAHSAFAGRLLPGYDMVDDDADPEDEGDGMGWGHGTHIAGIIAHVSPQSKLLPVRVLNSNGRGNTFALAYAIQWAVEHGANVINLSLGADANSRVLHEVIEDAIKQGVIIVAAAGNIDTSIPQFPASWPGVIGVTAVDAENAKAEFAAYGAGWVDLAAPGVGITSTIVGPFGSGYASWSGTSMSTGFVSGAAALARQRWPAAPVTEIQQLLTAHTRNVDDMNPTYIGQLGGLLDVAAALDVTQPVPTPTPSVPTGGDTQLFLPFVRR